MHSSSYGNVIVLVGFMGAGKTSVGQELARLRRWRFVDLDQQIQQREGRAIADIFRDSGEPAFRRLETEALRAVLEQAAASPGVIAALGGGAFAQQENLALLQAARYPSIFLDAPLAELRRRCAADGSARPLFQDENQFRQLYEDRRDDYMKADFRVDTAGKTVAQVAAEVGTLLGWDSWK
jgi:shikimate kinase